MILSIDQSYSGTGVAYISEDGRVESAVVKTKPAMSWASRIDFILDVLNGYFDLSSVKMENPSPVKYVVLESYAYSSSNSMIFQLGELGGIIKYNFHKKGVDPYTMLIAHPKMFMARNGKAEKNEVMNGLKLRFGIEEHDDNAADAISIGLTFKTWLDWKEGIMPKSTYDAALMMKIDKYMTKEKDNNGRNRSSKRTRKKSNERQGKGKAAENRVRNLVQFRPESF